MPGKSGWILAGGTEPSQRPKAVPGQMMLLEVKHDLATAGRQQLHRTSDPHLAVLLEKEARQLAVANGWSTSKVKRLVIGLRILVTHVATPDGKIRSSDVRGLQDIELPVGPTLHVLDRAGVLTEDRIPAIDTWFANQIHPLPATMQDELCIWFDVMRYGSNSAPRRYARSVGTISLHARWAMPYLKTWAAAGHTSLREISHEEVLDALPTIGNARSTAGQGLKSIFRILKGRKVLFADPTARVKTGEHQARQPLPVDLPLLRSVLLSPRPEQALITGLLAFHGLRLGHLQRLKLTDIRDGRLQVDGRVILLAVPVRERLTTYLNYRSNKWPMSPNAHLLITRHTAGRDQAASQRWIRLNVAPLNPRAIREDRILNELHANGGDVLALAELFGLSYTATARYLETLDNPALTSSS